ncbi:hypothetical protein Pelo_5711 [Pelomyxa schiedti]|nr:hypothetical protein Pelo_5711 [Pelomyxa schiedti]
MGSPEFLKYNECSNFESFSTSALAVNVSPRSTNKNRPVSTMRRISQSVLLARLEQAHQHIEQCKHQQQDNSYGAIQLSIALYDAVSFRHGLVWKRGHMKGPEPNTSAFLYQGTQLQFQIESPKQLPPVATAHKLPMDRAAADFGPRTMRRNTVMGSVVGTEITTEGAAGGQTHNPHPAYVLHYGWAQHRTTKCTRSTTTRNEARRKSNKLAYGCGYNSNNVLQTVGSQILGCERFSSVLSELMKRIMICIDTLSKTPPIRLEQEKS